MYMMLYRAGTESQIEFFKMLDRKIEAVSHKMINIRTYMLHSTNAIYRVQTMKANERWNLLTNLPPPHEIVNFNIFVPYSI